VLRVVNRLFLISIQRYYVNVSHNNGRFRIPILSWVFWVVNWRFSDSYSAVIIPQGLLCWRLPLLHRALTPLIWCLYYYGLALSSLAMSGLANSVPQVQHRTGLQCNFLCPWKFIVQGFAVILVSAWTDVREMFHKFMCNDWRIDAAIDLVTSLDSIEFGTPTLLHFRKVGRSLCSKASCRSFVYVLVATCWLGPPVAITQRSPYVLLLFLSVFLSFFLQREISGVSWPIAAKLCHVIGNECNFKKLGPKFGGPPPKKFGAEKRAFWGDFGRLHTSIANISGTEEDMDNRKTALQITISPASADIIWWTLIHKGRKIGPSLHLSNSQHVRAPLAITRRRC